MPINPRVSTLAGTDAVVSGNTITQTSSLGIWGGRRNRGPPSAAIKSRARSTGWAFSRGFGGAVADQIVVSDSTTTTVRWASERGANPNFTGGVVVTQNEVYKLSYGLSVGAACSPATTWCTTTRSASRRTTVADLRQPRVAQQQHRHPDGRGHRQRQPGVLQFDRHPDHQQLRIQRQILNNLIYANTNGAVNPLAAQPGSLVANNTIYQPVGDAIRVQENSDDCALGADILYVAAGYDMHVTPIPKMPSPAITTCSIGARWSRKRTSRLLEQRIGSRTFADIDWQAANGQDLNSEVGDPLFVDPNVADNAPSYSTRAWGMTAGGCVARH